MSRSLCPDCGANRGLADYGDKSYCFACHKVLGNKNIVKHKKINNNLKVPDDLVELPNKAKEWLAQYYINEKHIEKFNIRWSESLQRIIFPDGIKLTAWARDISPNTRHKWLWLGPRLSECNILLKHDSSIGLEHSFIIVEDIISAIRVSDYNCCICNGGTSIRLFDPWIKIQATWFDGDKAGQIAAEKFRCAYKLTNNIKNIVTKKDPKCHTPSEMEAILNEFK